MSEPTFQRARSIVLDALTRLAQEADAQGRYSTAAQMRFVREQSEVNRATAQRHVETLLSRARDTYWNGDGVVELRINDKWHGPTDLAALIMDRVLGAEQDGGQP